MSQTSGSGEARLLELKRPDLFLAPPACACCLAVGSRSLVLRGTFGESVSINYCEDCLRHASAARTRLLAICLASALLGVTSAVVLPIAWVGVSIAGLVSSALLAAVLPVALALVYRRRPTAGHTSSGHAVWWWSRQRLYCENGRFARVAARQNSVATRSVRTPRFVWSSWYWLGPLATLIALPASIVFNTASVRVLNLTPPHFVMVVDGRSLGEVETTSAESPAAGREFRIVAGERHFVAIGRDGRLLSDRRVALTGGGQHLYVPASPDVCFWLEFTSYGRQQVSGPRRVELARGAEFWPLPESVDTWFAPSPLPAADDNRSSGGKLTALRQGECRTVAP